MGVMLSVKDLVVNYGAINAIKGISFDVNEGEIVTLIGANHAPCCFPAAQAQTGGDILLRPAHQQHGSA